MKSAYSGLKGGERLIQRCGEVSHRAGDGYRDCVGERGLMLEVRWRGRSGGDGLADVVRFWERKDGVEGVED